MSNRATTTQRVLWFVLVACRLSLVAASDARAAEQAATPSAPHPARAAAQPVAAQPEAAPAPVLATFRIGSVNVAKLFSEYNRTKAQDVQLQQKGKQKEEELKARVDQLKELQQGLGKSELLNDQTRESKARELEHKQDDLQNFRKSASRELGRERDKLARDILTDVYSAIEEYGKTNGFTVILDQRSLTYAQSAVDVTDDVLKLLNSHYSATR